MEERLERDRPLWTIDLLEGVDRERVAYLVKVHHCMADGIASLRLAGQLLWDREVERAGLDSDGSGTPELVDKRPGAGRLLVSALRERVSGVHDTLVGAGKALLSRDARRADEAELERLPGTLRRELHATSARSPFDTAIGRRRTVGLVSWSLEEVRRVGHAHGATVNDVLLAAVGGGLRRWLAGRGQLLPDVRVKVPVSMHRDGEGPAALGNRDSFFCIDLPLHAANPGERLEAVRRETVERKRDHDAEVLYAFFNDLAHVSKRWYRRANAVASRPGVFSLCVSNLPGPQEQLDVLGGAIEEMYSLAEIGDRHGLRISVSSYHGRLSVGLCADALAVADIGALERSLEEELAELTRAASGPG
jgi:WS/DGAT/MGAT family acyltransferase